MPNSASLTFRLFGVDISAKRAITDLGFAAAATGKEIEIMGRHTLKATALAGALAVGVAGLSVAAVGAAGVIGVGLGGAILGLGVKAALLNTQLKQTFKDTGTAIKNEIAGINGPIVKSLTTVAANVRKTFAGIRPQLAALFKAEAPVFGNLGKGLTDSIKVLAHAIGPLFATLTPIINVFSKNLAPLLQSLVTMLLNILVPLRQNIGAFQGFLDMIGQLLPLIGALVGSLVVLGAQVLPLFVPLLNTLVAALTPLLTAFGILGGMILPTLTAVLGPLLHQLSEGLMKVLPIMGQAIIMMLPPLGKLVSVLLEAAQQVLPVLLPLLAGLVSALAGALADVLPVIEPSLVQIVEALAQLLPVVTPLLPSLVYLARSITNLLPPLITLTAELLIGLMPGIVALLPWVVKLSQWLGVELAKAITAITPPLLTAAKAISGAIFWLIGFVRGVVDTVQHSQRLHDVMKGIADFFIRTFTPTVQAAVKVFKAELLPALLRLRDMFERNKPQIIEFAKWIGKATVVIGALIVKLAGFLLPILVRLGALVLTKLIEFIIHTVHYIGDFIHAIENTIHAIGNVIHAIGNVIHAIENFIHACGNVIHAIGNVIHAIGNIVRAAEGVVTWFNNLHAAINKAFTGAQDWLLQKGKDILAGLGKGLKSAWDDVLSWFKGVPHAILHALGIKSPPDWAIDAGKHIMNGLLKGMGLNKDKVLGFVGNLFSANLGRGGGTFAGTGGVLSSGGPVQNLVKQYAQNLYGWSGAQWDALNMLLTRESSFNPNAQNPTSTAYGLFQFLNSTWAAMGASKTSDPVGQIIPGLRYIAQRYGSPAGAWAHEVAAGWYGGGMAPTTFSTPTLIGVGERGPETVSVVPRGSRGYGGGDLYVTVNLSGVIAESEVALQNAVVKAVRRAAQLSGKPAPV